MISATSRYVNATLDVITDERGTHQVVEVPQPENTVITYSYYQIAEFDTVDRLADTVLGDGRLWWRIADANPEILDWSDVPVGTVIRMPSA